MSIRAVNGLVRIGGRGVWRIPKSFPLNEQKRSGFEKRLATTDAEIMEDYTVKALTWEMEVYQRKSAERTVPWFLKNLPKAYFDEIDADLQKDHLRALTALTEAGLEVFPEEEAQKLCELAHKGDIKGLKRLINMGAHPNIGDYDGRTPIHLAASEGKLETLKFLSTVKGFNINVVDRFGWTPLVDAIKQDQWETIEWIRSKGGLEQVPWPKGAFAVKEETQKKTESRMVELMLKSRTKKYITFFMPTKNNSIGEFSKCISQLPLEYPLIRVRAFTTKDYSLGLNVFVYALHKGDDDVVPEDLDGVAARVFALAKKLESGENVASLEWQDFMREDSLRELLLGTKDTYIRYTKPARVLRDLRKVYSMLGSDSGVCTVRKAAKSENTEYRNNQVYYVTSVVSFVHHHSEMERFSNYLGSKGLSIDRFDMDVIKDPTDGTYKYILRAMVEFAKDLSQEDISQIEREVPRLKYLDDRILNWTKSNNTISMEDAEVASSLGNLVFSVLNQEHPHMFSLDKVQKLLEHEENLVTTIRIAKLWQAKFNPEKTIRACTYEATKLEIEGEIRSKGEAAQHLLRKLLHATDCSLRTNFFLKERRSLTIRVKPELMMVGNERVVPFGVFFCHSRNVNGFHVRFRDIARGGLRIVPIMGFERFGQECRRQFEEVYGLAFAQQLKNKDIPEGGSKALCMVNVSDRMPNCRDFLMRKAVRSFADGLLDLITPDPEVRARIVDYYGEEELLYLGPDENIIPEDISWVSERAAKRGMKYPAAFMSSKTEAGINHKVYGVTSEGVAVFLKVALKEAGLDPENGSFTVKITGGPNGDVAGNMIKILGRDYQGRAKIVGMCDHSGGVENEEGLDMDELLRLYKADLPLSEYDPSKVGTGGQLYGVTTADEIQLRNTMHNRLKADAFIPAGGRPNTININNFEKFFLPDGKPSSPLIVEAANIFITPEARAEFAKRGISIVKDSSANKAGVSCSSYEIVSSMLLSKDEFMAVKDELVEDVLRKLRESARVEAELLFREYRANPSLPIVYYSEAISGAINRACDAVVGALIKQYDMINEQTRQRLLMESLPNKLVEVAGEKLQDLPKMYLISMMGSKLGSKIVYNEGLQFIETLTDDALVSLAAKYVQYDDSLKELFMAVELSDIKNKESLLKVLKAAGVKSVISSGILKS